MHNILMRKNSFTLIELILSITIATIILTPLSMVIVESVVNAFLPEHYETASALLGGELERVANLRFANVVDESSTSFTGNFSQYSYQVDVDYVNGNALNTSVSPTVTAYKRAEITISHSGFPDVVAVTVVTDN